MAGRLGPWSELLVAAGRVSLSGKRTLACYSSICANVPTSHALLFLRQELEAMSRPRKSLLGEKFRIAARASGKFWSTTAFACRIGEFGDLDKSVAARVRVAHSRRSTRERPVANARPASERNTTHTFLAGALALALIAQGSRVCAAGDTQQIKLGPHNFYVPEAWMIGGPVVAIGSNGEIRKPQTGPITATALGLLPQQGWQPFAAAELPESIDITRLPASVPPPLDRQTRQWLDESNSHEPDSDGFVRVAPAISKPDQRPMYEIFLYRGYLNNLGRPLIIMAENWNYPLGNRAPSNVYILIQQDLSLHYRFDNRQFPKNGWWSLYQRVLTFIDYLQQPK